MSDETVALHDDERRTLDACEDVIRRGLETFVQVGEALARVRDERLYRDQYGTFAEYCRQRWNLSDSRVRELIGSAKTSVAIATLDPDAPTPANEGQARALRGLDAEQAVDVMRAAHEQTNGKPTAATIRTARELSVVRDHEADRRDRGTVKQRRRSPNPLIGRHERAVDEVLRLVERLERIHDDEQFNPKLKSMRDSGTRLGNLVRRLTALTDDLVERDQTG